MRTFVVPANRCALCDIFPTGFLFIRYKAGKGGGDVFMIKQIGQTSIYIGFCGIVKLRPLFRDPRRFLYEAVISRQCGKVQKLRKRNRF